MPYKVWSKADLILLRHDASMGRSKWAIARRLRRLAVSVELKARELGIELATRRPGAPDGNRNGMARWYRPGNYPARWHSR